MENNSEREISLVDLLATTIRHRLWVYLSTSIGVLLALAVLVLPLLGFNVLGSKTIGIQAVARINSIPDDAKGSISIDVQSMVQGYARDLSVLGSVYRQSLISEGEKQLSQSAFNAAIKKFANGNLSIVADTKTSLLTMTLKVAESSQQKGQEFLKLLVDRIGNSIREYSTPLIEGAIANLSAGKPLPVATDSAANVQLELRIRVLKGVLQDRAFPLVLIGSVEAFEEESRTPKEMIAVLVLIGSIVAGFVFAFAAEAVRKTRQDQVRMERLRAAWKRQ